MTKPPLLEITNLVCGYGRSTVIHGIDLRVEEGEVVSLLGANGAGKTTTLAAVSGLIPVVSGSIRFAGKEIGNLPASEIVLRRLIQVPERRQLFGGMSVEDNLLLGGFNQLDAKVLKHELDKCYAIFPRLAERKFQLAKLMSGGEQQMLAIGRAMMAKPRLLLLDEPTLGLAPQFINTVLELVGALKREGCTVVLVEQNAHAALKVSDRGYVMSVGKIAREGRAVDLLQDKSIQDDYLGSASDVDSMEARIRSFAARF